MPKIIAGLDIGTRNVCLVIGTQSPYDGNKLEVLGVGRAAANGMVRGTIVNVDKAALSIGQALRAAEEDSGINIQVVNANISGRHLVSMCHHGSITRDSLEQEITLEDITKLTNDMYRTVTSPGTQMLHALPQEYTIDYEIATKDPVGMSGVKLEANFHVLTAKSYAVQNIHKCLRKAGIAAESVIASPLATSLAILSDEEKEVGVCLVDFGASLTTLTLYVDSIIQYTATIPWGGDAVTADIQHSCMVMERQAEALKIQFGSLLPEALVDASTVTIPGLRNRAPKEILVRNLAKIIQARVEELIEFVHEELVRSGWYPKLIAGIVATGGGSNMPGIQMLLQKITGLDTRLGLPDECVDSGSSRAVADPMYATAVGLALAGFKALDYREAYHQSAASTSPACAKRSSNKEKKQGFSFTRMLTKTKAFLIEDYDDK